MTKALLFLEGPGSVGRAELLTAARQLFGGSPAETYGVALDPRCLEGADSLHHAILLRGVGLGPGSVAAVAEALGDLQHEVGVDAVLFRRSPLASMLAPRLAARLGAALVTEVVGIRTHDGQPALVRRHGNRQLLVQTADPARGPLVIVVCAGAFPETPAQSVAPAASVVTRSLADTGPVALVERRAKDPPSDIRDAEILISGGGGAIGSFGELQQLAAAMGGQVAASRRAVDLGVADRSIQVGQSGRTVSPRLYMAIGIDGAGQHIEGLADVEWIISVNTNRTAPICSISDLVVEGDASDFIEQFCRRLAQGAPAAPEGKDER